MNIVIDTNVLIRFLLADDEAQHQLTCQLFDEAQSITIPTIVLCETVWVLRSYKINRKTIATHIKLIAESEKVVLAEDEVKAGLNVLESGGDFADGVAACVGRKLSPGGTAAFVSFDKTAVRLLKQCGQSAFEPT